MIRTEFLEQRGVLIDYRDIYDAWKDRPADRWSRDLEMFSRIYAWRKNDKREERDHADRRMAASPQA